MLIVTKSPVRISYAGGGSDYPSFFEKQEGNVVSATIDKYVYFMSLPQWPLAEDQYRFTYRKTESVHDYRSLEHPVLRQLLLNLDWRSPLNMATMADVPGESGLGSSSAFTSAAIQNLSFRQGNLISGFDLARKAIEIERIELREPGGWQDQAATACGGFRSYAFNNSGFQSKEIVLNEEVRTKLQYRQLLVATEFKRRDSSVAQRISDTASSDLFERFKTSAHIARRLQDSIMTDADDAESIYAALVNAVSEHWNMKKTIQMDSQFQVILESMTRVLDDIMVDAYKLLGSGNGGYLLILAEPEKINKVESFFGKEKCIRFNYSDSGTTTEVFNLS